MYIKENVMRILSILSITFLIVFAVGCDEMKNQAMKPIMTPESEGPTEDEVITSVGGMKDPSMEDDDKKDPSSEDKDSPQTPDATSVTASPASGNISESGSIILTFDNDPGQVTSNAGTVSGSGNTRTISGPFTVGSLTLSITWTNDNGSHTLNYTVEADAPQIPDATSVTASPASGNISESGSIILTFDNDPGQVTSNAGTVSGTGNTRTISGPFTVGSLTLTITWTNGNGSHTLTYNVEADAPQIPDATFVTASPASGNISESGSIILTYDNDPGQVTSNAGTVSGSGNTRTISGPFTIGSLTLTITWTNGNGSHTLNYNVEADAPQIPDATFVTASPASGNISESGSINLTFDNDPGQVTSNAGTVSGSGNTRTISGPFTVGSLTLTITWTNGNGSHTLTYNVEADAPQIPDATFVTASPASGNISESGSIILTFDNDPGQVTVNVGTVSGSGNTRTISGPFTVGQLTLKITWTNGNGSHTLNYTVEADDTTAPEVSTSSVSDGTMDVDPDTVSNITVTFDEDISSHSLKLLKNGADVGWTAMLSGKTITLTKGTGQELSHDTTYQIKGTVKDSADNEKQVSITFTTKSAPVQQTTVSDPDPDPEPDPPLARGEGLRIGVTAPTFSVLDSGGNTYDFNGNVGGSINIVIVFYRGWW